MDKLDTICCEPDWGVEQTPQCCGSDTLTRLWAEYPSTAMIKRGDESGTVDHINASFLSTRGNFKRTIQNHRLYMPVWVAFCAVLDDLYVSQGRVLYIATDNVVGFGDLHLGAFCTRNFCEWLANNELANVTESAVTGNVKGWMWSFYGHGNRTVGAIQRGKTEFLKRYWHGKEAA